MPPEVIKINNDTRTEITRYPNGAPECKTPYVNDKAHGVEIWWWNNGQKSSEIMRKDGKRHGVVRAWRKSGEIWHESMTYKNNKVYETYTGWYESGWKEKEVYYVHNKEYARIEWDEKGDVVLYRQQQQQQASKQTNKHNHCQEKLKNLKT